MTGVACVMKRSYAVKLVTLWVTGEYALPIDAEVAFPFPTLTLEGQLLRYELWPKTSDYACQSISLMKDGIELTSRSKSFETPLAVTFGGKGLQEKTTISVLSRMATCAIACSVHSCYQGIVAVRVKDSLTSTLICSRDDDRRTCWIWI